MKKYLNFLLRLTITVFIFFYIIKNIIVFDDIIHLHSGDVYQGYISKTTNSNIEIITPKNMVAVLDINQIKNIELGFISVSKNLHIQIYTIFCLLLFTNLFLAAKRLSLLLHLQKVNIPLLQTTKICFISNFFSNFLPGFTGGDIIKIYYIHKYDVTITSSAMLVLSDRIIGLFSLILLVTVTVTFNIQEENIQKVVFIVYMLFISSISGVLFAFFCPVAWLPMKNKFFLKIIDYVVMLRKNPFIFITTVFLSLIIHSCTAIAVYGFAKSISLDIPLYLFFVYVPLGFLMMMLPISLGGWGVGEVTYAYLFSGILSNTKAVTVSILLKIAQIIVGIAGGVLWIANKEYIEDIKKETNQVF